MAKAKSARPEWRASVSRIRASERTSSAVVDAAIGRRDAVAQPAAVAELADQGAAFGVDVVAMARRPSSASHQLSSSAANSL